MEFQTVTYQRNNNIYYYHDYSLMVQKIVMPEKGLGNLNIYLTGHCHAIWQLYKKLEGAFASIEFQN